MSTSSLVMFEEEFKQITAVIDRLLKEANAKIVFLMDKDGQLIAASGDTGDMDTTALASLTAGNIAATGGLAKLIGEKEFSILSHEGEKDKLHISIVGQRAIVVVIFDQRSSFGLVRLRVKKANDELNVILQKLLRCVGKKPSVQENLLAEITDTERPILNIEAR
ncbi:MAG: roadblock/LC7 domain-containing protein [Deltaproteobacteria bacterium]|nr:roadblock/LC7 domain-containing protein [Deltaproteobacteria bacterium]